MIGILRHERRARFGYGSDTDGGADQGVGGNDPQGGSQSGGGPAPATETTTTGGITLTTTIDPSKPDPSKARDTGTTADTIRDMQIAERVTKYFIDLLTLPVAGAGIARKGVDVARAAGLDVQPADLPGQNGGDYPSPFQSLNTNPNADVSALSSGGDYTSGLPGASSQSGAGNSLSGSNVMVPGTEAAPAAKTAAIGIGTLLALAALLL